MTRRSVTQFIAIAFCSFMLSACELTKGSVITPGSVPVANSDLTLIIGEWTGSETATVGESGALTAIFDTAVDPTQALSVRLIWWSERLQVAYRGTARGTLGSLGITADQDNPPIGTRCGYVANASLNAADDTISGSYTGVGAGVCGTKAGTFVLRRQGPPPCTGSGSLPFSSDNKLAVYPPDWIFVPGRDLPSALPVRPFAIPAGTWDFRVETGDQNHLDWSIEDPLNQQDHEQVTVPLYGSGGNLLHTLGPTMDVPWKETAQTSTFAGVVLSEPVASLKVVHAWSFPVLSPQHSVEIRSVAYGCPR